MNYVFLDEEYENGHILMSDLEHEEGCSVIYKDRLLKVKICNFFVRMYISQAMRKYINLPCKGHFYRRILNDVCDQNTKVIVMTTSWFSVDFIEFLRKTYKQVKLVLIIRDTVESNTKRNKDFEITRIKSMYDLVISYDGIHDVKKYGLVYAPVYMSKVNTNQISLNTEYDISLVAATKDRLEIIHNLYKKLNSNGVNSYIYLVGAPEGEELVNSTIIYSNKKLKRMECLRKELESNCILEVLKGDAHSNTLRFWEAIIYNKKFYTNWEGVVNSEYYNPQYVKVFTNFDDIDVDFIKRREAVDYHYNNELSPVRLISLINDYLYITREEK